MGLASTRMQFVFLNPMVDDEETVLQIRNKAISLYSEGKTVMQWQGQGTQATRQFTAPVESILAETLRCLQLMNPSKYGSVVRQSGVLRIR